MTKSNESTTRSGFRSALFGADLIVVPFAAPPVPAWRSVMITRAFENGVRFAPTNKVGREGDWTVGGASMIVDPFGQIAAECDDLEEGVIAARVGRQAVFAGRREKPMFRDRRPDLYRPFCTASEDIAAVG